MVRRPAIPRPFVAVLLACAICGLGAAPAMATFPGRDGQIAFRSDAGNAAGHESHAIWVVSPGGTGARRVTPGADPPKSETDYSPVFFPDGRRFAYIRQVFGTDLSPENQIFVKAAAAPASAVGTPVLPEPVDYRILSLGISPSGRELAIAAEPPPLNETQVFLVDLPGGEMTQLTSGPLPASSPDFSPDGGTIVFSTRRHRHGGIFTVRSDGSGLRRLTARPGDGAPSYSPSGGRIVFNRHAGRGVGIFSMRANGGDVTRLTSGRDVDRGPVFSPDGRSIAFARAAGGRNPDLYAMRADGSGVHLVYRSRGRYFSDFAPDWGPKPR